MTMIWNTLRIGQKLLMRRGGTIYKGGVIFFSNKILGGSLFFNLN